MKRFHEQFKDRVDCYDGSVVLREDEYNQICRDAYHAGQESTMKWVSEECKRNTERLMTWTESERIKT